MSISATEYFNENKYIILTDAIDERNRKFLTEHLFKLKENNLTQKDEQCPLSDSIYGDDIFEELSRRLADQLSIHAGKRLLPTYTYARIYRTGEVLEPHIDREACEYSATVCLDYKAEACWPIFFGEDKRKAVFLNPGELILYKGREINHSRPEFKGDWQAQVFLHYVDADGPFKDWANDKRELREKHQNNNLEFKPTVHFNSVIIPPQEENLPGYFCIDGRVAPELKFTEKECGDVLKFADKNYSFPGSVGSESNVNNKIRSVNIYDISLNRDTEWLYSKIASVVSFVNTVYFKYDIAGIVHNLQLMEYSCQSDLNGHYDWHVDMGNGSLSLRKISLTIQLSDERDYDGCDLLINNNGSEIRASKERGSIHLFPSYMLHKVTPIERGKRYSLVIWVHGSNRFR